MSMMETWAPLTSANAKTDRNEVWCQLYRDGKSCGDIADMYGVSRERVCQILRRANLIEHRAQRRRLARELLEEDKAAARAAKAALESQLIELVRGGQSIASAAAALGFTKPVACYICAKHGIASTYGRHRSFAGRIARLTELVEAGRSLHQALETISAEEGRKVAYTWAWRHCPELAAKHRRHSFGRPKKEPVAPVQKHLEPKINHQETAWTEERTARLLELWFGGASAQQIADIFGDCSRNAILGHLHRLRLSGKLRRSA